ncbi:MAG: hypothetical protein P1U74_08680 [Legionellaceae bacterium]|nr:hypothetical protein [Legionellaceae bacterium]
MAGFRTVGLIALIAILNIFSTGYASSTYQHCFTISTWVVPPQTLLAYLYNLSVVTPVSDQTVWVINNYNQGYFNGIAYPSINNVTSAPLYMIGSVTPDGKVKITFYSTSSSSADITTGDGSLTLKSDGRCFFTMQTNSDFVNTNGLIHWSDMVPVKPGDSFYTNVPGTNGLSIPEYLGQF